MANMISVLWFGTFWSHLSVESFSILAVVVDHVLISDPLQLTHLGTAQLAISG